MATAKPVFSKETFQFFRELGNNNRKAWMDENRARYQSAVVQPFRRLLEELATPVLKLNGQFDTSGRTGANFSRINRDIRSRRKPAQIKAKRNTVSSRCHRCLRSTESSTPTGRTNMAAATGAPARPNAPR